MCESFFSFFHTSGGKCSGLKTYQLQSSEASQGWLFDALSHQRICSCRLKTKGAKTVSLVTDTSHWLMQPQCGTAAPHPHPSGQDPLPSLHITQWPETKRGREAKKEKRNPDHLFHLLNESNFLPESTRRVRTSVATLNYLTLIRINKSWRDQDRAVTATADFGSTSISPCWGVILCCGHLHSQ